MINKLSVLNTVSANSADFQVTPNGKLNIAGLGQISAGSITNIEVIPSFAEQIKKAALTFQTANSTDYALYIQGYAMSNGAAISKTISFTSEAASTQNLITALVTERINALSDFNVVATNAGSGVVVLTAKAATASCPNAPLFNVSEGDANILVTADATATAAAAPTGGETAVLEPVINASGVMTGIRIISGGSGYLAAPLITIANGGGAGTTPPSATCTIFEGEIVAIQFTAGTTYTYVAYKGFQVTGTGAALKKKYNFIANQVLKAVPNAFEALTSLVDATNYTEVIISYNKVNISGTTQFANTTDTAQVSLCVSESATNAADIIARGYGSVSNLRKGYRTSFQAAVALDGTTAVTTTTYVVATGVLTLSAASSNGIKGGDLLLVGATPAYANTVNVNAIAKVQGLASQTSVLVQIGGNNLIAAITTQTLATRVVARESILG